MNLKSDRKIKVVENSIGTVQSQWNFQLLLSSYQISNSFIAKYFIFQSDFHSFISKYFYLPSNLLQKLLFQSDFHLFVASPKRIFNFFIFLSYISLNLLQKLL